MHRRTLRSTAVRVPLNSEAQAQHNELNEIREEHKLLIDPLSVCAYRSGCHQPKRGGPSYMPHASKTKEETKQRKQAKQKKKRNKTNKKTVKTNKQNKSNKRNSKKTNETNAKEI